MEHQLQFRCHFIWTRGNFTKTLQPNAAIVLQISFVPVPYQNFKFKHDIAHAWTLRHFKCFNVNGIFTEAFTVGLQSFTAVLLYTTLRVFIIPP